MSDDDLGTRSFLTVPNAITVARLGCLPVYCWLLFGAHHQVAAAWLLAGLGVTDFIDGYVARHFNQVSTFGKILDPIADRLLVGTAVISTALVGAVPVWFATATLLREVVVSVAVVALAAAGSARIDVVWIGKAGAMALMVAYPLFLGGWGGATWQRWFSVLAWVIGSVGLSLSWVALVTYVGPAREAFARGRAGRAAPQESSGPTSLR